MVTPVRTALALAFLPALVVLAQVAAEVLTSIT